METIEVLGYLGALVIGLVLGLMGSGGSIMAVPIFAYLFQISPITTTAYSLFVVGTSASVGTLKNFNKGLIDFRIALVLAIPAFISVFIARKFLVPVIPEELVSIGGFVLTKNMGIMLLFSLLMTIASISMLWKKGKSISGTVATNLNYPMIVCVGTIIGVLTGIVGIGGGFLIIPTLVLLVKLPIKKAVATSLFIIALKSLIGFTGDVGNLEINWSFLLVFTLISVMGIFLGVYLSTFIKNEKLKKSFGWFVLFMAIGIFWKEILA
ncbi:sulfite exporter TauE/SafE family protein [Maribacter sp. IgM3_T14_3]|uniref:sulfite exporter TauE/SafE family protein n=1 Tax=Maribacter sp. IgM3_T14_3 TaxID=3415140 RepID=UPI003C6FA842